MNKKKKRTGLGLLILLLLLLLSLMGFALGKYSKTLNNPGNVTFSARLADTMTLLEHQAVRQTDGTYELDMTKTVTSNIYILIPGVDIPKDPHITISGRTSIPAYLFIEVDSTLDTDTQVYKIDTDKWELLPQSGTKKVYYYKSDVTDGTIYILKDHPGTGKQIEIKQAVLSDAEKDVLSIHALLMEKVGEKTPLDTYNNN